MINAKKNTQLKGHDLDHLLLLEICGMSVDDLLRLVAAGTEISAAKRFTASAYTWCFIPATKWVITLVKMG